MLHDVWQYCTAEYAHTRIERRRRRRGSKDKRKTERDLDRRKIDRDERGRPLADAITEHQLADVRTPGAEFRDARHEEKSTNDEPREQRKRRFAHDSIVARFRSVASR
jgi:hypothetical protein